MESGRGTRGSAPPAPELEATDTTAPVYLTADRGACHRRGNRRQIILAGYRKNRQSSLNPLLFRPKQAAQKSEEISSWVAMALHDTVMGLQDYWRQLSANCSIVACRTANSTPFLRPVVGSASFLSLTAMFWRFAIRRHNGIVFRCLLPPGPHHGARSPW